MRIKICILLLLLLSTSATSQSVSTLMGARANGMGYTSAVMLDAWGVFNNIAGIANLKITQAAFTYDHHPSLTGGNRTGAVFIQPIKIGVIGTGVYRFGDDVYNEHMFSAGFSNQFGIAALGAQVNYIQYRTEGFGSKGVWSINLGGIAELTPQLSVGAYILNVNQPSITETDRLPTKLVAGIAFKPIDKFFIATEIEKDMEYDATLKMGFEYTFHKKFVARTGYNIKPNTAFFGLGFKTKKFNLDYALQHNTSLQLSHQASVLYQFAIRD